MRVDRLSWSRLNALYKCGEFFRLRYLERRSLPSGLAQLRGLAVDDAVSENLRRKRDQGELAPLAEVEALAAGAFHRRAVSGELLIDGDYVELSLGQALGRAKDETIRLAKLHARKLAPSIDPVAVQKRITVRPSSALPVEFVAVLDLVDRVDGGVAIRDTKTARRKPAKDAANVSDQLSGQALAWRCDQSGQAEAELSLDYLVHAQTRSGRPYVSKLRLPTQRTRADLQRFVDRAQAALRVIEAEAWLPAPPDSWQCSPKWCGYWNVCVYGGRGRERPTS